MAPPGSGVTDHDDAQATRKVARQTLRLARLATADYSTADVGTDD